MTVAFDETRHCGATGKRGAGPCRQGKGARTDHAGAGHCWLHGGRSPGGRKEGQREAAAKTLALLAIPVQGDPLEVLQDTVESSYGVMLAARELLIANPTIEYADLYRLSIREAAKVAKGAVESVSIDRMDKINARITDMLERAQERALERVGIPARRRDQFRELMREEIALELAGARN